MTKRFLMTTICLVVFTLTIAFSQSALAITNGDFELGDFTGWGGDGLYDITTSEAISGNYSAIIATEDEAFSPGSCTFLYSNAIFPQFYAQEVTANFKVRYATAEMNPGYYQFYSDPFQAMLKTDRGMVTMVSINTDGLTPGPRTTVTRMDTNSNLMAPIIPSFTLDEGTYYPYNTPVYNVTTTVGLTSTCNPVQMKFYICNWDDDEVSSAAYIDDVAITFKNFSVGGGARFGIAGGTGTPCPEVAVKQAVTPLRKK